MREPTDPNRPVEAQRGRDAEVVVAGFRTVLLDDPVLGVLAHTTYMVRYANGKNAQGVTDAEGRFRVRTGWGDYVDVAVKARVATRSRRVMLSKLPASTSKGAWARLVNLGYVDQEQPPADPDLDDLRLAIKRFQTKVGLRRTGNLDLETADLLQSAGG